MPVIADSKGAPRIVVVARRQNVGTVSRGGQAVQVPAATAQPVPVRDQVRVIEVAARGPQGAQGLPGRDASGALPAINFAFGDASPSVVLVLAQATEMLLVSLQVEEAFDGAGAAIALGTAGDPALLMPASYNDPAHVGVYEAGPRVELPAGTGLVLTITPGAGATKGRGQLVLTAVPLD